jgi:uncharacterized membrane protein HdeD (DUF308 family)
MTNQSSTSKGLEKTIKASKTLGIVILVIGVLALVYPNGFGKVSAISIGAVMILGGHFRMTLAVVSKSMGSVVLKFLFGLFMIFSGTGFIGNPDMSLVTITLALAVYLLADGVIAVVYGFSLLSVGKGIFLLSNGIVSILIAILIFILGTYIGVKLITDGLTFVLTGNIMKKALA